MLDANIRALVKDGKMRTGNNWGVGVVLLDVKTGDILVGIRSDTKQLATPGGKVEIGESPLEAVVRECLEETNVKIKSCVLYDYTLHTSGTGKNWVSFLFVSTDYDATNLIPQPGEMDYLEWLNWNLVLDAANSGNLFGPTKKALDSLAECGVLTAMADDPNTPFVLPEMPMAIPYVEVPTSATEVQTSATCAFSTDW